MLYPSKHRRFIMSKVEGFSLVEMLIYMLIMVLMLGVITNMVISMVNAGRIIKSLKNIENSALISVERILRETRQANTINLASSVFDSNPGRLVLDGTDDIGNPRTVDFYLSSGRLMFRENGIDVGAITQADAQVNSLVFRRFSGPSSEGIRAEMTLESGTSTHYRSNNFYFSAVLR